MLGAAGDSQATLPYGTHLTATSPPRAGAAAGQSQVHGAVREAAIQPGARAGPSAGPPLAGGGQIARQPPRPPSGTGKMVCP